LSGVALSKEGNEREYDTVTQSSGKKAGHVPWKGGFLNVAICRKHPYVYARPFKLHPALGLPTLKVKKFQMTCLGFTPSFSPVTKRVPEA
jgi:hypothetical protein